MIPKCMLITTYRERNLSVKFKYKNMVLLSNAWLACVLLVTAGVLAQLPSSKLLHILINALYVCMYACMLHIYNSFKTSISIQ